MFVVSNCLNASEGERYENEGWEYEEFESFEDAWNRYCELTVESDREDGICYSNEEYEENFSFDRKEFEECGSCGDGIVDLTTGYPVDDLDGWDV